MSLKVPKANNVQLFKEGYKVRSPSQSHPCPANRLFFFAYSQHLQGLEDAVLRNIQAVAELSDLVRTSFGPNGTLFRCVALQLRVLTSSDLATGRNKLLINHLGKLFVTSDAATIIREIEVVHPAAKLLVMGSQAQETEVRTPATRSLPRLIKHSFAIYRVFRWATQQTQSSSSLESC